MAEAREHVEATLIEFADTLVSDYDLIDYLDRLLERSAEVLGADGGGVLLDQAGDREGGLRLLAYTDERIRELEERELALAEGPCLESHHRREPVAATDLTRTQQWPEFAPVALAAGFQAVFAFPMRLRGSAIGALNLYRRQPGAVSPADVATAQAFADMATIGILHQRALGEAQALAHQLQTALHSRVVIEQAKGIAAERLSCHPEEAYEAIRWFSRNHNRRLREVAAAVIDGGVAAEELRRAFQGRR